MNYRTEKDSQGTVKVPVEAYFGASTQRAVENFPISGIRFPREFISSLALIKKCAARVNAELGLLSRQNRQAIETAAREVIDGEFDDQFVVDIFQTGSGTSTNMNMNEVISSRANEILTGKRGGKSPVHPNDHVNLGQSSNDVIPTAIHISAVCLIHERLIPSLRSLQEHLLKKASEFETVKKIRWLASGPRCGFGEISIPALQPGSSIMPGKVNPVIPETVLQVAAQVIGNDAAITLGGQGGNFELNTMLPVIAYNLLQSIDLLASAAGIFADRCIKAITADRKTCAESIEQSLALATYLVPRIGYDAAAAISEKAYRTGKSIRQVAREEGLFSEAALTEMFGGIE